MLEAHLSRPAMRWRDLTQSISAPIMTGDRIVATIDVALFAALALSTSLHADRVNAISYGIAILVSFGLKQVWRGADVRDDAAEAVTRFIVISLASLLLSMMIVVGLATIIPTLAAKFVSLPAMWLWQRAVTTHRAPRTGRLLRE